MLKLIDSLYQRYPKYPDSQLCQFTVLDSSNGSWLISVFSLNTFKYSKKKKKKRKKADSFEEYWSSITSYFVCVGNTYFF